MTLVIVDDDRVERTNLHRQILFTEQDVGRSKAQTAAAFLRERFSVDVEVHEARFVPESAQELLEGVSLVLEGSDNFPTKFLAADACFLAGIPIVHGAALRWYGTALAVAAERGQGACYRCLFEAPPLEEAPTCADAGVIGPAVGLVGAAQADLALRVLAGDGDVFGTLVTVDGHAEIMQRKRHVRARRDCTLCGEGALAPRLAPEDYLGPTCNGGA
jgi:molybdopterin/thiamine biosynthesis adenylyltransferase